MKIYLNIIITTVFCALIYFLCEYTFIKYKILLDSVFPIISIILVSLHINCVNFISEFYQKLQIKKQFGGYVSPILVEKLQKNPELIKLGGEKKELSVVMTDMRNFTALGESYGDNVEEFTKIMNLYMDHISNPILDNGGCLIKFIGDASLHVHGAPLDDNNHAKSAVKTGLDMLHAVENFNRYLADQGKPPVGMGVGVNTGQTLIGNIGSKKRFGYDVLGDTVSLASRLEGQSKPYGVGIILGPLTAQQVKDTYPVVELDCIAVKGKKEGVKIYTLAETPQDHAAYLEAYYEGDWFSARFIAEHLVKLDTPLQHYYENMLERINAGKPESWDGTFRATSK